MGGSRNVKNRHAIRKKLFVFNSIFHTPDTSNCPELPEKLCLRWARSTKKKRRKIYQKEQSVIATGCGAREPSGLLEPANLQGSNFSL